MDFRWLTAGGLWFRSAPVSLKRFHLSVDVCNGESIWVYFVLRCNIQSARDVSGSFCMSPTSVISHCSRQWNFSVSPLTGFASSAIAHGAILGRWHRLRILLMGQWCGWRAADGSLILGAAHAYCRQTRAMAVSPVPSATERWEPGQHRTGRDRLWTAAPPPHTAAAASLPPPHTAHHSPPTAHQPPPPPTARRLPPDEYSH